MAISTNRPRLRHVPILYVALTLDELEVMWTLCITIACAKLGACRVVALPQAAICFHFNEVNCSIQAAF
jgi:hypothetical protein